MLKKLIIFFILLIGSLGFSKKVTVTILSTTDTHCNLTSYDYLKQVQLPYGFMQASSLIKKLRKDKGNIVLVDCGDTLQGSPLMDHYVNDIEGKPIPAIEIMNYLKYDVAVPGNHDFDYGRKLFEKAVNESKFKWISANIVTKDNREYIYPYSIIEREGVKIGFFGLTTPFTQDSQPANSIKDLNFKDLTESAAKVVKALKKENVDLIVGLVHSGIGEEGSKEKMLENACAQIAENVKGIDVIICGHTHEEISFKTIGETLICQPGDHLKSMGIVLVDLQKRDGKWEILSKSSTLLSLNNRKPDKKIAKIVKYASKGVEKFLNKKIGKLPYDVSFTDKPFNPGEGFKLYYESFAGFAKPDVFMYPIPVPGAVLINKEKVVRVRDLYKLVEYNNYLVLVKMKGEELKSLMEYTTAMLNTDGTVKSYYPLYNCDSFYNIDASIDLSKDYGNRVIINTINGKKFNVEDFYTVATTTYRYGGGGAYFMSDKPDVIKYSEKTIRQFLLDTATAEKDQTPEETLW